MTIAACYVSPEGVVLGADSTTTFHLEEPGTSGRKLPHYFNYAQKLFEISLERESATLGIVTWGLGGLGLVSYRTLIGRFADNLEAHPAPTLKDVADRWAAMFWGEWTTIFQSEHDRFRQLHANPSRTPQENEEYSILLNLSVGFCIGGYESGDNRTAGAYEILFDPRTGTAKPTPTLIPIGYPAFWGVPNMIKRLLFGIDDNLANEIVASSHWTGSKADLQAITEKYYLSPSLMPLRDAIDLIHAGIYSTIKGLKFSNFSQLCGGPIEIAVISADRHFRWVRHKRFDEAIAEQEGGNDV